MTPHQQDIHRVILTATVKAGAITLGANQWDGIHRLAVLVIPPTLTITGAGIAGE